MATTNAARFDDLLQEDRTLSAVRRSSARSARVSDEAIYARRRTRSRSVLGAIRRRARVVAPWDQVLDWKPPHAKWFVGGKLNVSVNCLDRHVRGAAPQQGRAHLGRRAGRSPHADLLRSLPRGLPVRQRPEVARRQEGRPRRDLPAADPRAGDRDARLRAHRRGPHRRLRRLQRRVAARSHQRRAGHAARHRRRRLPPRPGRAAEADGRRGARRTRRRSSTSSSSSGWHGAPLPVHMQGRPRSLVSPADAGRAARVRARADGRRGHALHPLHVRHDRQAEGHRPHDRRLPRRHLRDDEVGLRSARTTTSTGAPPTSAGSPATATSSTARSPTARRC